MSSRRKNLEWYLALFALITIVVAFWAGKEQKKEQWSETIHHFYPDSIYQTQSINDNLWEIRSANQHFFVVKGEGKGYSGRIKLLIRYDSDSVLGKVHVVSSNETPSYFSKVMSRDFLKHFEQEEVLSVFKDQKNIDVISGATKTCTGITEGVKEASLRFAEFQNITPLPERQAAELRIGSKEIIILFLFLLGILSRIRTFPYQGLVKWLSLFTGMIFLGFVYNEPISLTRINSFLIGFWPDWHSELHIYLLIFGVLLIFLTSGKNVYCHSICPFGHLQELTARTGNAKPIKMKSGYLWIWVQRLLAWAAVLLALFFRNPVVSEYEVFGPIFQFTGSVWLFVLLALVIIASLLIKKPWCNFFCPIHPIFGFLSVFRKKMRSLWKTG